MGTYFAMITHRTYEQLKPVCDNVSARGQKYYHEVCANYLLYSAISSILSLERAHSLTSLKAPVTSYVLSNDSLIL